MRTENKQFSHEGLTEALETNCPYVKLLLNHFETDTQVSPSAE